MRCKHQYFSQEEPFVGDSGGYFVTAFALSTVSSSSLLPVRAKKGTSSTSSTRAETTAPKVYFHSLPHTRRRDAVKLPAVVPATTSNDDSTSASSTSPSNKSPVGKVLTQTMALDGAEWISVRNMLLLQRSQQTSSSTALPSYARTKLGVCTAVTGSVNGQRIAGLQVMNDETAPKNSNSNANDNAPSTTSTVTLDQDASIRIYCESLVTIPDQVSELDALWTLLQSLSLIHCVRPVLPNLGGSSGDGSSTLAPNGHIVVLGSAAETAVQAARLFATLDYQVTLVTSTKPAGLPSTIRHVTPTTTVQSFNITGSEDDIDGEKEDEVGFASVLGKFDAVLDTLGSEQAEDIGMNGIPTLSTTLQLLADEHGCHTYVSVQSESQKLVIQNGLLWGPSKTKEYQAQLSSRALSATAACFPSPVALGKTVTTLLSSNVIWASPKESKATALYLRGWSLKDFWEYTTWPRDANSNVRFGFPSAERSMYDYGDDDDDDELGDSGRTMISAPPLNAGDVRPDMFLRKEQEEEEASNPDILKITGIKGLQQLVTDETSGVLFLSAPFCRTCRYLSPQYRRLARQYAEKNAAVNTLASNDTNTESEPFALQFIKAEASGAAGKELGRALGIDSVPSFILFKKGRRYGQALSINRLPSKKLDLALAYLEQNKTWDNDLFSETKDRGFEGGSGQATNQRSKLF